MGPHEPFKWRLDGRAGGEWQLSAEYVVAGKEGLARDPGSSGAAQAQSAGTPTERPEEWEIILQQAWMREGSTRQEKHSA